MIEANLCKTNEDGSSKMQLFLLHLLGVEYG